MKNTAGNLITACTRMREVSLMEFYCPHGQKSVRKCECKWLYQNTLTVVSIAARIYYTTVGVTLKMNAKIKIK